MSIIGSNWEYLGGRDCIPGVVGEITEKVAFNKKNESLLDRHAVLVSLLESKLKKLPGLKAVFIETRVVGSGSDLEDHIIGRLAFCSKPAGSK